MYVVDYAHGIQPRDADIVTAQRTGNFYLLGLDEGQSVERSARVSVVMWSG